MEEDWPGDNETNLEFFDFTFGFLRSKDLRSLQDQGMACLLVFHDLIDELRLPQTAVGKGQASDENFTAPTTETEPVVAVTGLVKLTDVS